MGWLYTIGSTKKSLIEDLRRDFGDRLVMDRTVGNHFYVLARKQRGSEETFIALCLLAMHDGSWGYKSMDESMGPYYYDCPVSMLDAASPPVNDEAAQWREKCRQYAASKKQEKSKTKEVHVGDRVRLKAGCSPAEVIIVRMPETNRTGFLGRDPVTSRLVRVFSRHFDAVL